MQIKTKKPLQIYKSALIFFFSMFLLHTTQILPAQWEYGAIFFLTVLSYFDLPLSLVFSLWGAGFILFSSSVTGTPSSLTPTSSIPLFYFIFLLFTSASYFALKFEPEIRDRLAFLVLLSFIIPVACMTDKMILSKSPLGTLFTAPLFLLLPALFMAPLEAFYVGFFGAVLTAILARSFCLPSLGVFIGMAQQCEPLLLKNTQPAIQGGIHLFTLLFLSPFLKTLDAFMKTFFTSFHILFQCAAWGISCYLTCLLSKPSLSGRLLAFLTGCILLFTAFFISAFFTLKLYPQGLNFILLIIFGAFLFFYLEDTLVKKPSRLLPVPATAETQQAQENKLTNPLRVKTSPGMERFNMVEPIPDGKPAVTSAKIPSPKKALKQTLVDTKKRLQHDPENLDLLFLLGETQYNLGELSSAKKTFTKITTLESSHEKAHSYLTMIHYDEKRSKKS